MVLLVDLDAQRKLRDKRHPEEVLAALGIIYLQSTPTQPGHVWCFTGVDPETLPRNLRKGRHERPYSIPAYCSLWQQDDDGLSRIQ